MYLAAERLSKAIEVRKWIEGMVEITRGQLVALYDKHEIPYLIRSDGSVRVPEGWPAVAKRA